jgi:hypothetical protein
MHTFRDYREAPTNWSRAAHVAVGIVFLFAVARWWFR